jgi:hypothetical protein
MREMMAKKSSETKRNCAIGALHHAVYALLHACLACLPPFLLRHNFTMIHFLEVAGSNYFDTYRLKSSV